MFRKHRKHLQSALMSDIERLPQKHRQRLDRSWAGVFYREVFCRIDEEIFAGLYADVPSRPNVPVNVLVGLETLKAGFGWSDEELYDAFAYDLQVRYALGYRDLGEGDFDLRTLYYFRGRLSQYNQEHEVNLIQQAFAQITDQQLTAFKVRTGKQRMDSTQIASHIMDLSRLQLAVEGVHRLARLLSESEREQYAELLAPYLSDSAERYAYRVKGQEETRRHLGEVGSVLRVLLEQLRQRCGAEAAYQAVDRFFGENFAVVEEATQVRPNDELHSGCLQSLDDLEATYRYKADREYKGYVANVAETCDPDNAVQLITSVQVAPNNVADTALLVEALPELKARTGVETLITDGAYGSPAGDQALRELQVQQVPTGFTGRPPDPGRLHLSDWDVTQDDEGMPLVATCPGGQAVCLTRSHKGYFRGRLEPERCTACPLYATGRCQARLGSRDARFRVRFSLEELYLAGRRRAMATCKADQKLRPAVEATMRSVKHPFPSGQLPVRGRFRVTCMMLCSALMVNTRRLAEHLHQGHKQESQAQQDQDIAVTCSICCFFAAAATWLLRQLRRKPCFAC